IDNAYFHTTLPGGFTVRREADTPGAPILHELVVGNQHQQFAVTIGTLPQDGLEGLGDYHLRVSQPANFEPYRPAGVPVDSTGFRATAAPPAFVIFWPHGASYAEIALTSDGASTMPELFATFEQSSHNWQWK